MGQARTFLAQRRGKVSRAVEPRRLLTNRQREILVAIYNAEVYLEPVLNQHWVRKRGVIAVYQRTGWGEFSRPINISCTVRLLRRKRLVNFKENVLTLSAAGIVEAECIVSP